MKIELAVKALIQSVDDEQFYTVYLFDPAGQFLLPIPAHACEVNAINSLQSKNLFGRPYMYNTTKRIILSLGATLDSIYIYKVLENVFYAYLCVRRNGVVLEIDAKVTDALGIALFFDKPIFAEQSVLHIEGIKVTPELIEKSLNYADTLTC